VLARTHWLQGRPDQAVDVARACLALAETDSALSVCQALAFAACPVALWRGDADAARSYAGQLLEQAQRVGSGQWLSQAHGFMAIVEARSSGAESRLARTAAETLAVAYPFVQDQLAAIDAAYWSEASLARANGGQADWCAAEIWRVQSLRLWAQGAAPAAEALLIRSLELAAAQNALAWSLRSATSLARLRLQQGRAAEAEDLLAGALEPIREGTGTADRCAAAALLEALRSGAPRVPR